MALVDAFVGGVAVILILVILSSGRAPLHGRPSLADIEIGCADGKAIMPSGERVAPEGLATALMAHAPDDRLSMRVRIEVPALEAACAAGLRNALRRADQSSPLNRLSVFLASISIQGKTAARAASQPAGED